MSDKPAHTLVVTEDGGRRTYAIECPGVTHHCRTWEPADCPEAKSRPEWDDEPWFDFADETVAHGVEHAYIDGDWSHPIDECWLGQFPGQLRAAAEALDVGTGCHLVRHEYECGGEGAFTLELVGSAVT